jgi:hypothetical protein
MQRGSPRRALVTALFLWAPWPSDWITTLLLVAILGCLYVIERLS